MGSNTLFRGTALAVVLASVAFTAARAQEPATGTREIEEIVVTAQKREQSLQDVPIVVTSVSGQLLQDAGVKDIRELTLLTPGLTVTSTTSETVVTARIRGVGTVGDNPGLESSVGVVIDGVYRPRNGVSFGDLGDVSRIEVLKGPQGTLFGKNTSAGVISIITAAPTKDLHAQSEATIGDYETFGVSGLISGPVADGLYGSLYAAGRSRDGYTSVRTGAGPRGNNKDNDQNFYTGRGQLLWDPGSGVSFRVIADYTKRNESCCVGVQLAVGQSPAGRGQAINAVRPGSLDLTNTPFDRIGYANRPTDQRVKDYGVSGELNWDINPDVRLTSITAARKWRAIMGQDSDFTAADLLYRPNDGRYFTQFKQFSQELRFGGKTGALNWLVGGFYAKEDLDTRSPLLYGADYYAYFAGRVLGGVPGQLGLTPAVIFQQGNGQDDTYSQNDKTWALFTNNSYNITDQLELTVGARYTVDKKNLTSVYTTTGGSCDQGEAAFPTLVRLAGAATAQTIVGGLCINAQNRDFDRLGPVLQKRTEKKATGTVKLAYRFNPDVMTYGSYSRGYKAGGFNLDRVGQIIITATGPNFAANPNTSFAPEVVDSFELGAKTKWLDGSLLLNAALFHQTFKNFQLNAFQGTAFVVETLPKVVSRGVDMDFIYLPPIEGVTLQGGVTYADTEIQPFTAADLADPSRFNALRRLPGARLSFAPMWSTSLAIGYETDVGGDLTFRANASGKYSGAYNTGSDLHPSKRQPAFLLVNARIGIGKRDGGWTAELWANNLFDKKYLQVGFNGPYQVDLNNDAISVYDAFLGAPRTAGATIRFKY